ncbi:hypothetical protein KM043_018576 [Ampulex compressa]|uniref:Venom protein n=1 Tax=Ampulex compressa TaxID=860918 RepID=A0A1W6EVX3_AMPCP|nr:venom protein [Ampulex compressa]KAG7202241.1 hypothetical protein KM043_018576 [Ampulex compressa]
MKVSTIKATAALCLWFALCGIAASKLVNNEIAERKQAKFDILTGLLRTTKKVKRLMDDFQYIVDAEIILEFLQQSVRDSFQLLLTTELNKTRIGVDGKKAVGADAEYCMLDIAVDLDKIKLGVHNKFNECLNSTLYNFSVRFNDFISLIDRGNKVIDNLGSIYNSCTAYPYARKQCLDNKSDQAEILIESYKEISKVYPTFYRRDVKKEIEQGVFCMYKHVQQSKANITMAAYISQTCVEGAE